ncbi:COP1-interactive protein 1-like isoform X1 [Rana temporaria]|uniref:COP1-interactive protein 1-like isoform X1 n=1 Tax=Rana temporaria TaxID=8407 RepID=UPI001AACECD3|nr:COP1-interactive protein 1-like isoform X1 [Rana temporaria]
MASVPESKGVSVVLLHFMEIEKQLKEKDPTLDEEALQHLEAVVDAVKELEDSRRATRELLEAETIENSKLRYKVTHLPGIISKEIEAAVTSARECVSSEMLQLQNELRRITLELENTEKKQLDFEELNSSLGIQGRTLWNEHQKAVDLLNQHMADKAHQSIRVNQTHGKRKEAEEAVIEYQHKTEDLAEDMVTEKKLFTAETENLEAQILETQKKTEAQDAKNAEKKVYLSQRRSVLFDVEEKVISEKENVTSVRNQILLLQASHGRLTNKLDLQKKQSLDLSNKIDNLELHMLNQKEDFNRKSDSLNDTLSKLDEEMNTAEILHQSIEERHKALKLEYQTASEEEDRQHAMKKDTALQLEKSRDLLNEKQELLGKLSWELTEMDLKSEELVESMRVTTEHLAAQVDEVKEDLTNERQKRMAIQIKKDEVTKEMELWKLSEKAILKELKQRITAGQNKQMYLTSEGKRLEGEIEKWEKEIYSISEKLDNANKEYLTEEQNLKKQIKTLEEKVQVCIKHLENEQEKLAHNILIMKEAEDTYNKENTDYEDLKKHAGGLRSRQKSLEQSISTIGKDIQANLKIKEDKKKSLKTLRNSAFNKLQNDLGTIKQIDKDIYEINRKLELVIMENCRLKLKNTQYKDDINAIKNEDEKHISATKQLEGDLACLIEHLHKGWEEDNFICDDFSEREQEILDSIMELLKKINKREEKVEYLNGKLQETFAGLASLLQCKTGTKGIH